MILPGSARFPVTICHLEEDPISGSHRSYCVRGYNWQRRLKLLPFHSKLLSNGMAVNNAHTVRITQSFDRHAINVINIYII